jgi:deoxycytidylate deaminase
LPFPQLTIELFLYWDHFMLHFDTCRTMKKIVQAGIRKVIYELAYATDESSAALLKAGGVVIEAHDALGKPVQVRVHT